MTSGAAICEGAGSSTIGTPQPIVITSHNRNRKAPNTIGTAEVDRSNRAIPEVTSSRSVSRCTSDEPRSSTAASTTKKPKPA